MFNAASKLYFTLAAAAIVVGFLYVVVASDRVGFTNLVVAGVLLVGLGVALFGFVPREPVRVGDSSVGARPANTTDVATPSLWPMVGAAAIALVAAGAAADSTLILVGVVIGLVATFAWFGQVWREHPSWTPAMNERLHDRFVVPFGLPGTIVVFVGIGVISLSRLFLAIPREVAPFVGAGAAFVVLGTIYLIATRNVGRQIAGGLAAIAVASVLGSGIAGAIKGERSFEHHAVVADVTLTAHDIAFDKKQLDLPANKPTSILFINQDPVQHNLAILKAKDSTDPPLFRGAIVDKGQETLYKVDPIPAGSYYFVCDVHPAQMNGTVTVSGQASGAPGAGTGGTTTTTGH